MLLMHSWKNINNTNGIWNNATKRGLCTSHVLGSENGLSIIYGPRAHTLVQNVFSSHIVRSHSSFYEWRNWTMNCPGNLKLKLRDWSFWLPKVWPMRIFLSDNPLLLICPTILHMRMKATRYCIFFDINIICTKCKVTLFLRKKLNSCVIALQLKDIMLFVTLTIIFSPSQASFIFGVAFCRMGLRLSSQVWFLNWRLRY